jgi:alpha-N-acetylglucosaminidase
MKKFLLPVLLLLTVSGIYAGEKSSAADGVARRLIGERASDFVFEICSEQSGCGQNGRDFFLLDSNADGKILIKGNKPYSITAGFYHYLKKYTGSFVGQMEKNVDLPEVLPLPEKETVTSIFKIRNCYNYCTFSYTMAFWDWERWEREIDLIALYGVNQPLMIIGLEKVWQNFLRGIGYSEKEILDFIAASSHKAWWLMANLEGTGGPVSQQYIDSQYELALKILGRMRELGMEPISQSFFGMVPSNFKNYYKIARVINQYKWGSFVRPYVLSPTSIYFPEVAEGWYKELHSLYGKFKYYGGDLFHEGGFTGGVILSSAAKKIEKAMQKASPGSRYVLQGWGSNPKPGILRGLSPDHALVQKLYKDVADDSGNFGRDYGDKNWTLNLVSNFGGTQGLYSNLSTVAQIPELVQLERNSDCEGVGYLCEGTENNPVLYDLLSDVFWSSETVDIDSWIENYTVRRYGKKNESAIKAWMLLLNSIYNVEGKAEGASDSVICARPAAGVTKARSWSSGKIYWDRADVQAAAVALLEAASDLGESKAFLYDLTDVFRQVLQDFAYDATTDRTKMLSLIDDTEKLTASNIHFLLGRWLADAQAQGTNPVEKKQFAVNAKLLVTRWEPAGQYWPGIKDYSNRTWSGLVGDYYRMRWEFFFENGKHVDYSEKITELENEWIYNGEIDYTVEPVGDTVEICRELAKRWLNK